jgi:pimeloyl-ACP methyl ester carboxylesterase
VSRRRLALFSVVLVVVIATAGWWQMRAFRVRYEGRRPALDVMRQRPSDIGLRYEAFSATNPEGTRISGWWLPSRSPVGSIVMVHGDGGNKSTMLERAAVFVEAGVNVAVIDLRARGESGGERFDIGPGAALDVLAAVESLVSSGRHADLPILGYGLSHGARAVVLAAAQSHVFSAIVAEAPPYSLRASFKRITGLPWVPPMAEGDLPGAFVLMKDRPILLLLGDSDPEISQAQAGSLLSGNTNGASGIVVFAKTGHGVFRDSNLAQYRQRVTAFLRAVLNATPQQHA